MGDTGSLGVHVAVLWFQVRHTTNLMSIIYRSSQPLVNTAAGRILRNRKIKELSFTNSLSIAREEPYSHKNGY